MAQRFLAATIGRLLGLGALAFVSCASSELGLGHDFVDEAAEAHRQRILEEIAAGSLPAWAGSYRWSNGYEHHALELAPVGFWYEYLHCTGIGLLACGTVDIVGDGRIRLHAERSFEGSEPERAELRPDGGELLSIPWGPERFIVPLEKLPEFCADAAEPAKLQYGTYLHLLRGEDAGAWRTPQVEGLPTLPEEFGHLLPQ